VIEWQGLNKSKLKRYLQSLDTSVEEKEGLRRKDCEGEKGEQVDRLARPICLGASEHIQKP